MLIAMAGDRRSCMYGMYKQVLGFITLPVDALQGTVSQLYLSFAVWDGVIELLLQKTGALA